MFTKEALIDTTRGMGSNQMYTESFPIIATRGKAIKFSLIEKGSRRYLKSTRPK